MAAADIIAALVALLKADSRVSDLVGTRVFGVELPEDEASSMPRKAVVLRPAGGTSPVGGYVRHTGGRIDAICWGETPYEANRLSAHVHSVLTGVRRQTVETEDGPVLIHWVNDAGGRLSLRDAETNWPASTQAFQPFHAIEAAA